jgi:chemotaxis protein MotB
MPSLCRNFLAFATVLATLATAGCVRSSTHKKALADLASCQGDLGTSRTDRDARAQRVTELEGELVGLRSDRDQVAAARAESDQQRAALVKDLDATAKELGELRVQRAAAEKRLQAFRDLTDRFRKLVDTGKLDVTFRNGQMVLQLPAGILFGSGRADLSAQGKASLQEVLDILLAFKDRRFMVAGHTDNQPIRTRAFQNNWDLSTARAVTIVEFMIGAGFAPGNLAAVGYGEFSPVASNDGEDGRALNRRIEIILVPDLSELPNLAIAPAGDGT